MRRGHGTCAYLVALVLMGPAVLDSGAEAGSTVSRSSAIASPDWADTANWVGGIVPNGPSVVAQLGSCPTSPFLTTVQSGTTATIGDLELDCPFGHNLLAVAAGGRLSISNGLDFGAAGDELLSVDGLLALGSTATVFAHGGVEIGVRGRFQSPEAGADSTLTLEADSSLTLTCNAELDNINVIAQTGSVVTAAVGAGCLGGPTLGNGTFVLDGGSLVLERATALTLDANTIFGWADSGFVFKDGASLVSGTGSWTSVGAGYNEPSTVEFAGNNHLDLVIFGVGDNSTVVVQDGSLSCDWATLDFASNGLLDLVSPNSVLSSGYIRFQGAGGTVRGAGTIMGTIFQASLGVRFEPRDGIMTLELATYGQPSQTARIGGPIVLSVNIGGPKTTQYTGLALTGRGQIEAPFLIEVDPDWESLAARLVPGSLATLELLSFGPAVNVSHSEPIASLANGHTKGTVKTRAGLLSLEYRADSSSFRLTASLPTAPFPFLLAALIGVGLIVGTGAAYAVWAASSSRQSKDRATGTKPSALDTDSVSEYRTPSVASMSGESLAAALVDLADPSPPPEAGHDRPRAKRSGKGKGKRRASRSPRRSPRRPPRPAEDPASGRFRTVPISDLTSLASGVESIDSTMAPHFF